MGPTGEGRGCYRSQHLGWAGGPQDREKGEVPKEWLKKALTELSEQLAEEGEEEEGTLRLQAWWVERKMPH